MGVALKLRYLIAKYIPELLRNEPRNVGVILWSPWGVVAKFLGEKRNGTLDARSLPSWINAKVNYKEWLYHWRKRVEGSEAASPEFLPELKKGSYGNYVLCDGGEVIQDVDRSELESVLDFLFETLVDTDLDAEATNNSFVLKRACNRIITKTKVRTNPRFTSDKSVMCQVAPDVIEVIEFDYYYGNGTPDKLYKRVPMGMGQIERSVDSTAWKFDRVVRSNLINKNNVTALIKPTPEQMESDKIREAISVLSSVAKVINLTDGEDVLEQEFGSIALAAPNNA